MILRLLCGASISLLASLPPTANAQVAGQVDPDFAASLGLLGHVGKICSQKDGSIIVGGSFSRAIIKLNSDGSLNTKFNPILSSEAGTDIHVNSVAVQVDGKILVGGVFAVVNGVGRNNISRLNADGSLDASFNPGVGPDDSVDTIVVQTNGKIIIAGEFATVGSVSRYELARLNSDGSLDTSFDPGKSVPVLDLIFTVNVQTDGKIIIGGDFAKFNGVSRDGIARLNTDGSLDTSFDPGAGLGNFNSTVYTVALQANGKIIIAGDFIQYNGVSRNRIARLNVDGSLDTSFDPGKGVRDEANQVGSVYATALQANGKIIIAGEFATFDGISRNRIARLNNDGTLDAGFDLGDGADSSIESVAVQTDGKIVIGGIFTIFDGASQNSIARLSIDGSLDDKFKADTVAPGLNASVSTVAVQDGGKIIAAGSFTTFSGAVQNHIARFDPDGTLDTVFNPGKGANDSIYSVSVQGDGKVIIGGDFTTFDGVSRNGIARLNTDGTLDTSFAPQVGSDFYVNAVALQTDGEILIARSQILFGAVVYNGLARFNNDGTPGSSLVVGEGASGSIRTMAVQADGKIIIGGDFFSYDRVSRNCVARLNADGTLDTGFDPGAGAKGVATSSLKAVVKVVKEVLIKERCLCERV